MREIVVESFVQSYEIDAYYSRDCKRYEKKGYTIKGVTVLPHTLTNAGTINGRIFIHYDKVIELVPSMIKED